MINQWPKFQDYQSMESMAVAECLSKQKPISAKSNLDFCPKNGKGHLLSKKYQKDRKQLGVPSKT